MASLTDPAAPPVLTGLQEEPGRETDEAAAAVDRIRRELTASSWLAQFFPALVVAALIGTVAGGCWIATTTPNGGAPRPAGDYELTRVFAGAAIVHATRPTVVVLSGAKGAPEAATAERLTRYEPQLLGASK